MFEIFMFGGFWFWLLVTIEIIVLFSAVEFENGVFATISLMTFAFLLHFFGDVSILQYCVDQPMHIAVISLVYISLGAVWGVFKWYLFCSDRVELYKDLKAKFFADKDVPPDTIQVPPHLKLAWKDRLKYHSTNGPLEKAPLAREHKASIIRWMSFWPISAIWTFVNEFVKRIFLGIYKKLASFLQRISDNAFKNHDIAGDLEE